MKENTLKPRSFTLESLLIPLSFPMVLALAYGFFFYLLSELDPKINHAPKPAPTVTTNQDRQDAIRSAFQFAWNGYYELAFPHDELKPLSDTAGRSRNDWGATAIDALGTAIMMEQHETVKVILEHVEKLNFTQANDSISFFESTIRYIGGLLSAYELLNGPFASVKPENIALDSLVRQAQSLGNVLSHAFQEGQKLPSAMLDPKTLTGDGSTSLAVAGTMILEWTKLSELSQNTTFAGLARQSEDVLLHPQYNGAALAPGLLGTVLNIVTSQVQPSTISWGGGADSFYEYLIKFYLYDPSAYPEYAERWQLAADSTIKHLLSTPKGVSHVAFLGQYDVALDRIIPESEHYACFAGGNFLLAGMTLTNETFTDVGLRLVNGCHHTYTSTKTKIGPERWKWIPSECDSAIKPAWQCSKPPSASHEYFDHKGFWITEPSYNLRPETIESYYYAWRVTRDPKFRDWAWEAWTAINATTRLEHGFTYLVDVNSDDFAKGDNQESFFFSETLKYLYLIFDDGDGEWHVNNSKGKNEWVYSTEGHPLRILRH